MDLSAVSRSTGGAAFTDQGSRQTENHNNNRAHRHSLLSRLVDRTYRCISQFTVIGKEQLQAGAGVGAPFVAAGIQDVFVAKQVMPVMRQWL
jgi:hypothetical protein